MRDEDPAADSGAGTTRGLARSLGPLRVVLGIVLFLLVILAAARSWTDVRTALARMTTLELVLSELLVLVGLAVSVLTWQAALRELGCKVRLRSASKIYLVGQLGKYLPGSVWALIAQMELARKAGVPRAQGVGASIVAIGVNVVTGLAIGLAVVPSALPGAAWETITLLTMLALGACALSPPILTRLVNVLLGIAKRPAMKRDVSWRGVVTMTGWSVSSWICYGGSLFVLALAVGAPFGQSLPLCVAGMALAMTLGFLVVLAPSGIGVREGVMVAALAPVLDQPEALAVALVARLLFTIADLIAATAVIPVRIREAEAA